ncbi:MAG TPA: thiamine pyrophosphate-dependent dehydrogenase E1 component subunit alpha [Chloroflexota bacterium]|nr:thiamine pyrophosphate-dependent dehydrogenase E1 component subunit alpha [Chloroflexota bacterium]
MGGQGYSLPDAETRIALLRRMLEIRVFEEVLYRVFVTENMPGTMHQAIGQEAVSAGVGCALRADDLMTSTHRGHGHAIAKGVPLPALMAEMYAKSTGTSGGMGGSMHIFDLDHGFLGTTGIVGGGVPIAVGAALAVQLERTDRVVVAFFGDGAANQGAVHEALNLAAVWRLPVICVCENNRYAVSMPVERAMVVESVAERAPGYGMPGHSVDGNDAQAVYAAAREAIARARAGGGPTLIECNTYRYQGHSRFEPAKYRAPGELEAWKARDPIDRLREQLLAEGILTAEGAEALQAAAATAIDDAVRFALASPDADPGAVGGMVYA